MSETIDRILELADKISDTCEGASHYIMMCALIEVTTTLLVEMEEMAGEDHEPSECPFTMYSDILNRVLNSKLELRELEIMDESEATIH